MALSSNVVWEVRPFASDTNGGGFVPGSGTDYSQQDAPEATYTDLSIGNPTTTQLSSASRSFVAADVGNIINITGGTGFTTGRYEIISVSGGVATVDRSVGIAGSTGGSGKLGGALGTLQTAFNAMVTSNTIYITGTYTLGISEITANTGGAAGNYAKLIGYGTSRTDGQQATITATSATPTRMLNFNSGFWHVRNLKLDAANLVQACFWFAINNIYVENCHATQWKRKGFHSASTNGIITDCLADKGTGGAFTGADLAGGFTCSAPVLVMRCTSRDSSSNGFVVQNNLSTFFNCVAYNLTQESSAGGHGFHIFGNGSVQVNNCTLSKLSGSGLYMSGTGSGDGNQVQNTLFSTISGYGLQSTGTAPDLSGDSTYGRRFRNNAFYSVTLGKYSRFPTGVGDVDLTANPFVDETNGDLDLNNTAGGGAACRSAGLPGTLPGLSFSQGAIDIGALNATVASNDATNDGASSMRTMFRELTAEFNTTRLPDSKVDLYLWRALEEFNRIVGYSWADDTTTTLVAGTQEYTVPSGALEIAWIEHNGIRLTKVDLEELERRGEDWRASSNTGTPTHWAFYGNKLVLIPIPNAAAVAASNTLTIRYIRSPRDFSVYGPEGLAPSDYHSVVYYAVALYSAAHPDSAAALERISAMKEFFAQAAAGAAEYYLRRRTERGAALELLVASGTRRTRG